MGCGGVVEGLLCAATASSCLIWGHLRRKFAKSIVWKLYKMAFRTVNQGGVAMKGGEEGKGGYRCQETN